MTDETTMILTCQSCGEETIRQLPYDMVKANFCTHCGRPFGSGEPKFVPEQLRKAAALYEERNKIYGDNYKKFGHVVAPLLANIHVESPKDFNRLGILIQILAKVTRYCENFERGGHADSLDDLAVYAMMLQELDSEPESATITIRTVGGVSEEIPA